MNRRCAFLTMLNLGGLLAFFKGINAEAQQRAAPQPQHTGGKKLFQGIGHTQDEALQAAIQAAHKEAKHISDWLVVWTLKEVSGRSGGFAGLHQITVTIEANVP